MEDIEIKIVDEKLIKCTNCIFNGGNSTSITCAKFKVKPRAVYYYNEECKEYKENPYNDEESEDE